MLKEPEVMGEYHEMLSSGPALMNPQQFWMTSQDQASQKLTWKEEELISSIPKWRAIDSWWLQEDGESVFIKGVSPKRATML